MADSQSNKTSDQLDCADFESHALDSQDLAALLDGQADEACAQIVDSEGNLVTLTSRQLAEAGVDLANLGENDVQTLLRLAQSSSNVVQAQNSTAVDLPTSEKRHEIDENEIPAKKLKIDKMPGDQSSIPQETFNGSSEDVTEMDQETLASLVRSGSLKLVDEHGNEIPASAFFASVDETQPSVDAGIHDDAAATPTRTPNVANARAGEADNLIGRHVFVQRSAPEADAGGKTVVVEAIVRYARQGVGFKVQFVDDGSFAWVSLADMQFDLTVDADDDSEPTAHILTSSSTADVAGANKPTVVSTYAGRRSAAANDVTKNRSQTARTDVMKPRFTGDGSDVTKNRSLAMSRNDASNKQQQHNRSCAGRRHGGGGAAVDHQNDDNDDNDDEGESFVCPVCDKKVVDKRPSYIVIRLPACDSCAESKILVLDQ